MTIEQGLPPAAGIVVMMRVALALWIGPYWLLLTAFAGANLLQSAFTNWCPMVWFLARAGLQPCQPSVRATWHNTRVDYWAGSVTSRCYNGKSRQAMTTGTIAEFRRESTARQR
jgi:hypothetical protein